MIIYNILLIRRLSNRFINYVIINPSKIIVGPRGFPVNLPDFEIEPNFENIDKCLISQDRRRSSNKENVGSPKNKFLRTEIDTVKCLFSCSEILILLDKDYIIPKLGHRFEGIFAANIST